MKQFVVLIAFAFMATLVNGEANCDKKPDVFLDDCCSNFNFPTNCDGSNKFHCMMKDIIGTDGNINTSEVAKIFPNLSVTDIQQKCASDANVKRCTIHGIMDAAVNSCQWSSSNDCKELKIHIETCPKPTGRPPQ